MNTSVNLPAETAAPASSGAETLIGITIIIIILIIFIAIYIASNKYKEEEKQRKAVRFKNERMQLLDAARPFRRSVFVNALCKRILALPEIPEIKRIQIGGDCMTVTFDDEQEGTSMKAFPYSAVSHKDLKEDNFPAVACALAAELGPPFHVMFLDGQPTSELIVVHGKLLDPNIKMRKEQKQ